jgi:type IV secretory pathway TrbD component
MIEWILNAMLAVQSHLPTIPTNIAIYSGCVIVILIFAVALWVAFIIPLHTWIEREKEDERIRLEIYDKKTYD